MLGAALVLLPLLVLGALAFAVGLDVGAVRRAVDGLAPDERATTRPGLRSARDGLVVDVVPVVRGVPAVRRYVVAVRGLEPALRARLLDVAPRFADVFVGLPVRFERARASGNDGLTLTLERARPTTAELRALGARVHAALAEARVTGALGAPDAEGGGTGAPVAVPLRVGARE